MLNYIIYMLPAFILSMIAQLYVTSAYRKWSQVRNYHNLTGIEAAQQLTMRVGLSDIQLKRTQGNLTDHYDPRDNTLALSQGVADQPSVAALAITAHELGHALQDRDNYGPMKLRSAIVPMVNIGSNLGWILLMIGLVLRLANLAWMGVILFSAGALFSLITVPVELNASKRARQMLTSTGLVVNAEEEKGVSAVLNAAALTYVAGLATSLLQVLYFGSMVGGLGRRR
ncbi:MAG: zinc metallopeptidase [Chloroflexi bacterium]|jgi:Zn-dependent membrane protease YugP|nr:zinc metallopeptidase [Anaerolineaceae bacterium]NLI44418.1 zinc metallopeptidase [Chloroflexota bacterium]HOE34455.1 zinc metallopeptidase [Anaerolineaceae bacterium]HOT25465.1 zinc metallopeptidase [Anaerolineaceae bacterium]HQH57451.1 zinc metallopeptidase [Anaerolineaceae bacterium]